MILSDLRSPPGNRLEALQGDRRGQHSIRINDQWRICFTWTDTGPKTSRSWTTTEEVASMDKLAPSTRVRLQNRYDLEVERDALGESLDRIEPLRSA